LTNEKAKNLLVLVHAKKLFKLKSNVHIETVSAHVVPVTEGEYEAEEFDLASHVLANYTRIYKRG
jgi:molybdopterin/thiamine biosynthesis adenylyltransferase